MLKADKIARLLGNDLRITPMPDIAALQRSGAASVDLRLGRWFVSMKQNRTSLLKVMRPNDSDDPIYSQVTDHFVRFGQGFVLHPGKFILGATLEWVRLPHYLAGHVAGKSSWGRRGLIIETAPGIHPGFSGSITLELTNVGEVPVEVPPGVPICQLFLYRTEGGSELTNSTFSCNRKPVVSSIKQDKILTSLSAEA